MGTNENKGFRVGVILEHRFPPVWASPVGILLLRTQVHKKGKSSNLDRHQNSFLTFSAPRTLSDKTFSYLSLDLKLVPGHHRQYESQPGGEKRGKRSVSRADKEKEKDWRTCQP